MALSAYAGRVFDGTVRGYRLVDDNYFYYNCLTGETAWREFQVDTFVGPSFIFLQLLCRKVHPPLLPCLPEEVKL